LVQGISLLLGLLLGLLSPRVEQPLFHPGLFRNLANAALLYPLRLALIWLGLTSVREGLISLAFLPLWGQWVLCFVLLDCGKYWLHYMHHRVKFFWRFHRVHHSVEVMDSSAGLRMHAMDFIQLSLLPVVLFGLLIDTSTLPEPWLLALPIPGVVFDAFQHANMKFTLNTPLARAWHALFNNPLFHSWHHTREGRVIDGNYGNVLTIWDRLFGTDITRDKPPELYGISSDQALEESVLGWWVLKRRSESTP
jgi:sterol desaturase/sphingolipid hydroxylase (fatty acid hydroxylase superfamily)